MCLCGCGTGSSAGSGIGTTAPSTALSGNWLIAGSLPAVGAGAGTAKFLFSTTLTELGTTISPSSMMSYDCTTSPPGYGENLALPPATIANNAFTFTSETTTILGQTQYGLTLSATNVTSAPAGFMLTLSTLDPNPSYCNFPQGQTFTATKLADYTGTYTGTMSVNGSSGTANATVTMALQQGATNAASGVYSKSTITGSIAVTANGCSLTGTTANVTTSNFADGAEAQLTFQMSDGGTWHMNVSPRDATGAQLNEFTPSTIGGGCNVTSLATSVFTRQ